MHRLFLWLQFNCYVAQQHGRERKSFLNYRIYSFVPHSHFLKQLGVDLNAIPQLTLVC